MDANLLRAQMAKKGKTQSQVAKAIGISENSMSRKLLGKREFRLSEVQKLCCYLDILDPKEIFLPDSSQKCNTPKES